MVSLVCSYVSQALNTGVNLLSRLLLARLIIPSDWGLFAEALLIITIGGAMRDLGIPLHLIRDNGKKYGSALVLEGIMSLVVISLIWILAPLAQAWDPRLPHLLRIFSLMLLPEGLAMVPKAFLDKELLVNRALLCELLQIGTFAIVSLVMGYLGYGVWSLVAGYGGGMVVYSISLWLRAGRSMPLGFDRRHIPDLVSHSGFLFLNGLVGTSLGYMDSGILGSLVTSREVGYYFIAYTWAFLPGKLLFPSLYRIIYPTLARYKEDADGLFNIYHLGTVVLLAVELPVLALLFINAQHYVTLLLGRQWLPSVPLLRIIALGPALVPFSRLGIAVLKVHHKDRIFFLSSVIGLVSLLALGWFLTLHYRAMGMAYANLIAPGSLVQLYGLTLVLKGRLWKMAFDLLILYAICMAVFIPAGMLSHGLDAGSSLAIGGIGAVVCWMIYYTVFGRSIRALLAFRRSDGAELPETDGEVLA
ncbi:MAG: oligosaccharide flippase family protein [bacterium]|nr:oligosaccharide flippase family protein [bacterium]